jgi:broad specificity phosphatase PhoE
MSRTLEIHRHTDNEGDVLSEDGVAAALALGEQLAEAVFALVVSTGAQRATQTAANILAGGGLHAPHGVVVEPGLRSDDEDRWKAAYSSAGSGQLDALRQADPDFVASEARVLGEALRRVADRLADGQRALVIGHSPTNEAAIHGLTGVVVEPIGKGAGVVVTGHGDDWEVTPAPAP